MKWRKLGLVYKNESILDWQDNSALQPTPIDLGDRIRMYVGFRDKIGISRIGFVDLHPSNPTKVIGVSERPVLDIGRDGAFDESGVVPSAVHKEGDSIFLYYAGYQLGSKVRFSVLGGLAVSRDGGQTFQRHMDTPCFERSNNELLFRVPHTVIKSDGKFRVWYGAGSHFEQGENKTLPVYNVRYLESKDGKNFPSSGRIVLDTIDGEYRIGRPQVIQSSTGWAMFYGYSSEAEPYKLGYAISEDGIRWLRKDKDIGLGLSEEGWDSEMMAYPSIVKSRGRTFLFYNGNGYGAAGFGVAELVGGCL